MKSLILIALTVPFFANARYLGGNNCTAPSITLENCAYNNKSLTGETFKSACETEIKAYIVAYQIQGCGIWQGYADTSHRTSLTDSVNMLVHSGRYRDEIKAESERKAKEAQEAQRKKEQDEQKQAWDGLKINN